MHLQKGLNPLIDRSYSRYFVNIPVFIRHRRRAEEIGLPPYHMVGMHAQNSYEILLATEGLTRVTLNGQDYELSPGDLLICHPYDRHSCITDISLGPVSYYFLIFESEIAERALPRSACELLRSVSAGRRRFQSYIPAGDPEADGIRASFPLIETLQLRRTLFDDCRITARVELMAADLLEHYLRSDAVAPPKELEFIRAVTEFVSAHYAEPVSTEDISAAFSYSKSHFCHRCRMHLGCTFTDFLTRYRIEMATQFMTWTQTCHLPLFEIARLAGFGDYSYFKDSFQKYTGQLPSEYRASVTPDFPEP